MKRKILCILLLAIVSSALTGCMGRLVEKDDLEPDKNNPHTYNYSEDSRFRVVSIENIEDGQLSGLDIIVLVDKETKVMYMQTERFQAGYSTTLQVLLDKEGKPLIYDGELN